MRQWRLVGAWLAALTVATTLAWQIVGAADDRVSERSGAPLNIAAPTFTTSLSDPSTSPPPPPTSTTVPGSSTSSSPSPTSTPSGTSSSITTPGTPETVVIPTVGGTVTVRVVADDVIYLSAVPHPGFAVEVKEAGPPRVRVELVSVATAVEVRVRWRDQHLDISIEVD